MSSARACLAPGGRCRPTTTGPRATSGSSAGPRRRRRSGVIRGILFHQGESNDGSAGLGDQGRRPGRAICAPTSASAKPRPSSPASSSTPAAAPATTRASTCCPPRFPTRRWPPRAARRHRHVPFRSRRPAPARHALRPADDPGAGSVRAGEGRSGSCSSPCACTQNRRYRSIGRDISIVVSAC